MDVANPSGSSAACLSAFITILGNHEPGLVEMIELFVTIKVSENIPCEMCEQSSYACSGYCEGFDYFTCDLNLRELRLYESDDNELNLEEFWNSI